MCSETAPPGWLLAKCSIPGEEEWLDEGFEVPLPGEGDGAGKDVNFGLSAAAVSGKAVGRRWPWEVCVHPAIPSGAPAESQLAHHSRRDATHLRGHQESLMAQQQIVSL